MVFVDGMCMKHSKGWRSRLEWLTNQFRTKRKDVITANHLKMEQFVTGFINLICTCNMDGQKKPQLKEINDEVWRDITEDDFKASIVTLKNYNVEREIKTVVENLLKLLYGQRVLFENNFEMGIKGAYRLTFLMSKIIWNDFSLIQRYENELVRRQAKVQTFELMELPVERLDAFLDQGPTGSLLERFNNENHCEVTLKKVTKKDGTAVVSATIKKVVDTVADLGETIRQLRRLATATREQAVQMEVDSNASAAQSSSGAVPKVSSVTQPFVPQHNTQPFVPQTELKTPTVQNQSLSHSSMENVAQYFTSELDIQTKIRQVKDELKSWRNGIIVVQKLISEMNNEQQAGTWQSLLKFVHHFLELKNTEGNGAPRGLFGNR